MAWKRCLLTRHHKCSGTKKAKLEGIIIPPIPLIPDVPDTTTKLPDTTTKPPDTTTKPPDTTIIPSDTTAIPPDTTTKPPDTTSKPLSRYQGDKKNEVSDQGRFDFEETTKEDR